MPVKQMGKKAGVDDKAAGDMALACRRRAIDR